MSGTSRISREAYVRFCEGLGVQIPGSTRQLHRPTHLASSYFVGAYTESSVGFSPLRMRSAQPARAGISQPNGVQPASTRHLPPPTE
jgi:hypothetical protein